VERRHSLSRIPDEWTLAKRPGMADARSQTLVCGAHVCEGTDAHPLARTSATGQPQGLQHNGDSLRKDREPKVGIAESALKDLTEVMHSHQLPTNRRATTHQPSISQVRVAASHTEARTPVHQAGLQVQEALSPTTGCAAAAEQADRERCRDGKGLRVRRFDRVIQIIR
jgi:hypothetical protein